MSRSYRKTPGFCDRDPWMKNYANRQLRRISVDTEIGDGAWYKRYTEPYDICDWKFLYQGFKSYGQWKVSENKCGPIMFGCWFPLKTDEELLQEWVKLRGRK